MSNRRVSRAWLQSPIDVPGLPGATTQLSPEKTPKAVMTLNDLGLYVSQDNKGLVTNVFIPIANVKVAVFAAALDEPEAKSE